MQADVIGLIILFFFVFIFISSAFKIVRPWQRGIVERLGKYSRTVGSGLHIIFPFFEKLDRIDMREQVVDIPPQEVITKDNVVVTVDAVVYYEATDPVKLKYNVANFHLAATKLAQTNLRNVVGDLALDESLTSRETINSKLRAILDVATDKWGVRVVRVELQRIEPPQDVTISMHKQMKAERERRATILEAEGQKTSAILRAEGEKEAAIQVAEGKSKAIERVAEADGYKLRIVAEGEALAIEKVFSAIHKGKPTENLIAIRYMEALKAIADGKANKVFLPYEASGLLGSLGGIVELFKDKLQYSESMTTAEDKPKRAETPAKTQNEPPKK
jgi:regulator of protease activity HflC (stomatin/prohibitin superfamily)